MNIIFSKEAQKQLCKLDNSIFSRIMKSVKGLVETPPIGDVKVLKGEINMYRLRVGKYRIIFRYDNNNNILITSLGSRGDVYK